MLVLASGICEYEFPQMTNPGCSTAEINHTIGIPRQNWCLVMDEKAGTQPPHMTARELITETCLQSDEPDVDNGLAAPGKV